MEGVAAWVVEGGAALIVEGVPEVRVTPARPTVTRPPQLFTVLQKAVL